MLASFVLEFGMLVEAAPLLSPFTRIPYARTGEAPRRLEVDAGEAARLPCDFPGEWNALAVEARDRNFFFSPWALEPAVNHVLPHASAVLFVESDGRRLGGLVPVVLPGRRKLNPFPVASVLKHRHCYDTTPLLRPGCEAGLLDNLFNGLTRSGAPLLYWPGLPADTCFANALFAHLEARGQRWSVVYRYERPLLDAHKRTAAEYRERVLSPRRRKRLDRLWRQLAEQGTLEFKSYESAERADWWIGEFLRLEASGWKGSGGRATAMACLPEELRFFEQMTRAAAHNGHALFHSLELDGRPIAMTANFRLGDAAWAFKSGYDPAFARYAPGVLVEVEGLRRAIDDESIRWVDSCADPENALMAELLPERRPVMDVLIAAEPQANRKLAVMAAGMSAWCGLRRGAGRLYRAARSRLR